MGMDDILASLRASAVGSQPLARVLRAVVRADAEGRPKTRQDLAASLELSPATISKAVADLRRHPVRLVDEELSVDADGRSQKPVVLAKAQYAAVGIAVGDRGGHASELSATLANLRGDVILSSSTDLRAKSTAEALEALTKLAAELVEKGQQRGCKILGVGVLIGGHVNNGIVARSVNTAWNGVDIRAHLMQHLEMPAFVENDVTASMIANHLHTNIGNEWPSRGLVSVFDEGVGAGLVLNGTVYRGTHGLASEIGHVRVDYAGEGRLCRCGNRGCLEAYVTPSAVREEIAAGSPSESAYELAGQALGRALIDLIHLADLGRIELVLPASFDPGVEPAAKAFITAYESELETIYSVAALPTVVTTYFDSADFARIRTEASAAIVLQGLLTAISQLR